MKKLIVIIILIQLAIVACHKKALPEITRRTIEPASPVSEAAIIKPDAATGKTIFINYCGRCHGLPEITKYTKQQWDGILVSMIPKARLNKEQGIHLKTYVNEMMVK